MRGIAEAEAQVLDITTREANTMRRGASAAAAVSKAGPLHLPHKNTITVATISTKDQLLKSLTWKITKD